MWKKLVAESIGTFTLVFCGTGAIVIGGTVLLEAMFAGPVCGASMNPARSIAPAIVSGHLEHLWVYLAAPVAGAWLAALVWRMMEKGK